MPTVLRIGPYRFFFYANGFPRLAHASPAQRADYQLLGNGEGIHWPQMDEDISVEGLLAGQPSVEAKGAHV